MSDLTDKYRVMGIPPEEFELEAKGSLDNLRDAMLRMIRFNKDGELSQTERERVESALRIINKQVEKLAMISLKKGFSGKY